MNTHVTYTSALKRMRNFEPFRHTTSDLQGKINGFNYEILSHNIAILTYSLRFQKVIGRCNTILNPIMGRHQQLVRRFHEHLCNNQK